MDKPGFNIDIMYFDMSTRNIEYDITPDEQVQSIQRILTLNILFLK
jgi:hypothetical protein